MSPIRPWRQRPGGSRRRAGTPVRIDKDGERVWFTYPSAVEDPVGYLASEVPLEFGGRNVTDPNEQHEIVPVIAALTGNLDFPVATVTALSLARTFWEKATLIHVERHRCKLAAGPERLSRRWFGPACLARHDAGRAAVADRARTPGEISGCGFLNATCIAEARQ